MNPILTTIITGVCSVIVAIITSSWFAKKMTKDDRIDELAKDIKDIKERQKTIEQTVTTWQKCDENLKRQTLHFSRRDLITLVIKHLKKEA